MQVLRILEQLASVKMSLKLLTETLVAKVLEICSWPANDSDDFQTVNPFRKHTDHRVSKKAKLLFNSWKKVFRESR